MDDFNVCQKYPQVPITVPVDDGGYLTELAGKYAGQRVWAANKTILADLTESGAVMGQVHIKHQYPHCWRCHHPIIFRATEQWFCSIAKFREDVYKAIDTVTWMPDWGHDRMKGMVRDRNDWCISRQRTWGVPIPAFYCKKCGTYHITDATIKAVSDLFRKEGKVRLGEAGYGQLPCAQCLILQLQLPIGAVVAVLAVAKDGAADACHVGADLVGAAGDQLHLQQGQTAGDGDGLVPCLHLLGAGLLVLHDLHDAAVSVLQQIAAQGGVRRHGTAKGDAEVGLLHLAVLDGRKEQL